MRESVPTTRYSPVCNVLRQWKTSLILTYRVYRLYDISKIHITTVDFTSICRFTCLFYGKMSGEDGGISLSTIHFLAYAGTQHFKGDPYTLSLRGCFELLS